MTTRRALLRAALGTAAFGAAVPALTGCSSSDEPRQLSFLNWIDYIGPTTLADFTKATGVKTTYQTYESNDELLRLLLQASRARRGGRAGSTYDLAVPSDSIIPKLRRGGLITALDKAKITGLDNLRPDLLKRSYDPDNAYSIPWATGTTGIGYDTTVFSSPPDWTVFLDPKFKNRTTLLNESRDAIAAALFALGKDANTTSSADLDAAASWLLDAKKVIKGFNASTSYWRDLVDGKVAAVHGFSSDIRLARERNPKIAYVLPKQGAMRWVDNLVVPDGAERPGRAHEFITFFLRPEVSAAVSAAVKADTGNRAAFEKLPAEVRNDPVIFPSDADLARTSLPADLGDAESLWDGAWKRVHG
jgi:spermidine/putrescine transport system substrate-binding protein